ncbi:MAG TPA: CHAP domain-containing protein [Ktedonobacterales bacterium]|jgi:CHAP domain|nr:CHAP domain-containing protein [Ktedonobacterales bacterium]
MDPEQESKTDATQPERLLVTYLRRYGWLALAFILVVTITLPLARSLQAAPSLPPPTASCATLAALNPSATNGPNWGKTILKGFGAADGWFGVDVCSNGASAINVSCDQTPTNWGASGCAPGQPSRDGYGWTFQCPELIERFGAWAFGDKPQDWGGRYGGNAPDLWLDGNHPADYVMYPNGSKQAPVPGDILIWGYLDSAGQPWPAGPYGNHSGHIAVVAAVRNGVVVTAEQNVAWGGQDHPSDTLALTATPTGWILSGSTTPSTTLPTYRWERTMGASRATYGWLHSTKNTGKFQKTGAAPATPPPPPPSLSSAAIVTTSGALADLTWTQLPTSPDAIFISTPVATTRQLGAPPGATLRPDLAPATLVSADSRRIVAVDTDGNLWEARTASAYLGVVWTKLDAPSGVLLTGAPSVVPFADGALVSALGDDGALWWRSESPQRLGPWTSLGRPTASPLTGSAITLALPGSTQLLAVGLGADGRIYEAQWRSFNGSGDESSHTQGWTEWTAITATDNGKSPKRIHLTGAAPRIVATVEPGGAAPNSSTILPPTVDVFALDGEGAITWLRGAGDPASWRARSVDHPNGATGLLAATTLDGFLGTTTMSHIEQLYLATTQGVSMASLTMPATDPAANPAITWTPFATQAKTTQLESAGSALQIGPGASALLLATGDHALAAATPDAISILSGEPASAGTPATSAPPTWFDAGAASPGKSFSDDLVAAKLDPRWRLAPASAQALATANGLRLTSQPDGTLATLTQAALLDGSSMRVKVSGLGDGARAGLTLRFDEGDWLALTTDRAGNVQFCPSRDQKIGACQSAHVALASDGSLWFELAHAGATFLASVSVDGEKWTQLGSWSAAPTAQQAPTSDATAVWLPFTSAGLLVTGAPDVNHAPVFTSLKVVTDRARTPAE